MTCSGSDCELSTPTAASDTGLPNTGESSTGSIRYTSCGRCTNKLKAGPLRLRFRPLQTENKRIHG